MPSNHSNLEKLLLNQQQQLDDLAKELSHFRTIALAAHKDIEQIRENQSYFFRMLKPFLPVFRWGRNLKMNLTNTSPTKFHLPLSGRIPVSKKKIDNFQLIQSASSSGSNYQIIGKTLEGTDTPSQDDCIFAEGHGFDIKSTSLLLRNFLSSEFVCNFGDKNVSSSSLDIHKLDEILRETTLSFNSTPKKSDNEIASSALQIKTKAGDRISLHYPAIKLNRSPSFDVIIPIHNDRHNLPNAICSILNQRYGGEVNVIVIDDGSSDCPEEVISSFSNTRLIRLDRNQGTYTARNVGLECATGDLVTFQDSDDISLSYRLMRSARILTQSDAELYIGTYLRFGANGEIVLSANIAKRQGLILLAGSTATLRDNLGGFDRVRAGADSEFVERAASLNMSIFQDDVITYLARHRIEGLTTSGAFARWNSKGEIVKNFPRDTYVSAYRKWHKSGIFSQIPNPSIKDLRQFSIPSILLDGSWPIQSRLTGNQHYDDALQRYTTLSSNYDNSLSWYECVMRGRLSRKTVTAVIISKRGGRFAEQAFSQVRAFRYNNLQIIYIANCEDAIMPARVLGEDIVQFFVPHEKNLGYCLNFAADRADGEFIFKIDDDDLYGPDYVAEAVSALEFNYDFVGKNSVFYHFSDGRTPVLQAIGNDLRLTRHLSGATFAVRTAIVRELRYSETLQIGVDRDFIERTNAVGISLFSTSIFNFAVERRNNSNHTWKVKRSELLRDGNEMHAIKTTEIIDPMSNF